MYRTGDPRFRRRLNELENTLERANESAQSGLYIFGQNYIKPCFDSVSSCVTSCVDASCPTLNLSQRDRIRRQRGRARSRGRAELSFDFYDDWEEDETEGLVGWGNDEVDRITGSAPGYGTITNAQPGRQRGMSYPKIGAHAREGGDHTAIPGSSLFGKLFGGKALKYKPTTAGLQEHPGTRKHVSDVTEGEALLANISAHDRAKGKSKHGRKRSGTVGSGHTSDSYSSRGDIFPSDEETDAIPLDDEFAMVLERRTTNSGFASGPEPDSPDKSSSGKRPSLGRRSSTRRTVSTKSTRSSMAKRRSSSTKSLNSPLERSVPTLDELRQQELIAEASEEAEVERQRAHAQRLALERGLTSEGRTSRSSSPVTVTADPGYYEPSQLPTPLATDDEQDDVAVPSSTGLTDGGHVDSSGVR